MPVPRYLPARSLEELSSAVATLQGEMPVVCFKPAVGIFGVGFKILKTPENAHLLADVDHHLLTDLDTALRDLGQTERFRSQIVLAYLPDEERSVDCLAHEGRLVRCVVRYELADGSRALESNPRVEEYTRRLTERFHLSGLFNAQFKDHEGTPYVLEINARMSGGIAMTCLSGVSLPYWALRLAMGACTEADIPQPKTGLRVAEIAQAVVLGDAT
jgi:hypothetical protein